MELRGPRSARIEGIVVLALGFAMAVSGWFLLHQTISSHIYYFPIQAASYFSVQVLVGVAVMILGATMTCIPRKKRWAFLIGGLVATIFVFAPLVPTVPGCPYRLYCPIFTGNVWGSPSYAFLGIGTVTDLHRWVTIASCSQGAELQLWESQGVLPSTWSGLACFVMLTYPP